MSLRLTDDLEDRLANEAKIEGKPRSELVREALREFLQRRERERFMAEIVAAARALSEHPEAMQEGVELCEDFVALDNEALDIAEGREPGDPRPEENGGKWWK